MGAINIIDKDKMVESDFCFFYQELIRIYDDGRNVMGNTWEGFSRERYNNMIQRERLIGKQICIVRMLHQENMITIWRNMSSAELENLLEISVDEIEKIMCEIDKFKNEHFCSAAANEYAKYKQDYRYSRFQNFFEIYGRAYLRLISHFEKEKIDVWIREIDEKYIQKKVVDEKRDIECHVLLTEALEFYVDYYLEKINDLRDKGFALSVIVEMAKNVLDEEEIKQLMWIRGYTNF